MALPKGRAIRYIFFCHMQKLKKDAASITNAKKQETVDCGLWTVDCGLKTNL